MYPTYAFVGYNIPRLPKKYKSFFKEKERKIAFSVKRTNLAKSSRQTAQQA